jgi:hypothetical protein
MGWDLVELFGEAPLRVPQVEGLLRSQPETGPVAAKLAQPDRHFGGNGGGAGEDSMQGLPRDPKLPGRFTDRKSQRRQYILPKDCSGMSWRSFLGHRSKSFVTKALDHCKRV